jgi:hypothetical protein
MQLMHALDPPNVTGLSPSRANELSVYATAAIFGEKNQM